MAASRPAALRDMPQSSHTILPSSRWNESTVRVPLAFEQPLGAFAATLVLRAREFRDAMASTFSSFVLAR